MSHTPGPWGGKNYPGHDSGEVFDVNGSWDAWISVVDRAIAKAEGQS